MNHDRVGESDRSSKYAVRYMIAAIILFCFGNSEHAQAERVATAYGGDVSAIDEYFVFELSCCETRLSLGLVTFNELSALRHRIARREFLRGPLECTALGRTEAQRSGLVELVWCSRRGEGLLSKNLFSRGLARERCEISGNELGSCH